MTRSKKTKTPSISDVGETLVSEQEKRLAVRQQRDKIASKSERVNPPGAQASPELASLASEYMTHEDPNVRSLAAAVLRLVRAE